MVILITGASHTGKTKLAQAFLERLLYPCTSLDHLKMGLIRSGYTDLSVEDDEAMTAYLWPIARGMIMTAVENNQNLILEGCYVPADWRDGLPETYLAQIRFICLAFSDAYIEAHFDDIKAHADDIENRLDESYLTKEYLLAENRRYRNSFPDALLIDRDYDLSPLLPPLDS